MRGRILGTAVAITVVVAIAAGDAEQARNHHFLGLWEGVDVNDGSKRTISISDREGDGIFEVASRDSYWTLCDSDRAIELAAGAVRDDGVLMTDGIVTCFESGHQVSVQQTYEYSRREDTLFATPHGTTLKPIILHRVTR